jgi:hypothetical protein
MKSNDPETIRRLSFAFEYDKMNFDVASAIVDFSNKLNQNSELLQALPYWYRTDGKTEVFVQLNKEHKLNPKEVEFLGKNVLNSGKSMNYEQAEAKLGALRNLAIDPKTAWKPVSKIRDNDIKKENHREKDTMEK